MDFGEWIGRHRRETLNIDMRTAAERTGVDLGTISRVENGRTQPTLATVIRLCEGYDLALADMIAALVGAEVAQTLTPPDRPDNSVLSVADAVAFARGFGPARAAWLAAQLNTIGRTQAQAAREPNPPPVVPEAIPLLLARSEVFQVTLAYPGGLAAESLRWTYAMGGLLLFVDVGAYVRAARQLSGQTLHALGSATVLSRIETGTMERIKLGDVLALDAALTPDDHAVAGMFWRAGRALDALAFPVLVTAHRLVPARDIAEILVLSYRWAQALGLDESAWLAGLRGL